MSQIQNLWHLQLKDLYGEDVLGPSLQSPEYTSQEYAALSWADRQPDGIGQLHIFIIAERQDIRGIIGDYDKAAVLVQLMSK